MKKRFQNINKKSRFYLLAGIMILIIGMGTLTRCSVREKKTDAKKTISLGANFSSMPDMTFTKVEDKTEEKETVLYYAHTEQNRAYGEILWDAFYLGQIDGTEFAFSDADGNENGSFAIYDIDQDGDEELLLYFDGGSMSTNVGYIWGYKKGSIHIELNAFPLMRYYNNGIIEVDWSHNQGLAGDFWPYSVYIYNSETDAYQKWGAVDAWDKSSTGVEVNAEGESFPSDIDIDGDGIVYYILPADWDGYYDMTPLDGKDYENWRNDYLNKATEIKDIPFQALNAENISKLGASKPNIQFSEPLG